MRIIISILILNTANLFSQNFDWAASYNKEESQGGNKVCNDIAGNAYVAGGNYIPAEHGLSEETGFVAKYNSIGVLQWQKDLSDAKLYPTINAAQNLLVAGVDSVNCFIKTYDTSGTLLNNQILFSRKKGLPSGLGTDALGNHYISGIFWDTLAIETTTLIGSAGSGNFFLAKFNSSRNLVWARNSTTGSLTKGCLFVDAAGNSYAGGEYLSLLTIGGSTILANAWDGFILKHNSSGLLQWVYNVSGPQQEYISAISTDPSGNVYCTGYFDKQISIGSTTLQVDGFWQDIFFAKFTASGSPVWAKQIGGFSEDYSHSIALNSSGNIFLGGSYSTSVTTSAATCTLGGTVLTSASGVSIEPFIAKYDSAGNLLWAANTSSQPNSGGSALGLSVNNHDRLFVTGYINTQMGFGGSPVSSDFQTMFLTRMSDGESTGLRPTTPEEILISVFPTPATGGVTCEFTLRKSQTVILTVRDLKGQEIINETLEMSLGKNTFKIDPNHGLKGVYFLEFKADGNVYSKKLILN